MGHIKGIFPQTAQLTMTATKLVGGQVSMNNLPGLLGTASISHQCNENSAVLSFTSPPLFPPTWGL